MVHGFKKVLAPLVASFAILAFSPDALAQSKIGVIDTQRAIMETEDGLRAQATLKKLFDKRQHELDKKQVDLQKEREDIEKQRDVLSKGALQKRVEKWQREMIQLQTVFVEYNKELQKKQNELTQPIFSKAMNIIRRLASTDGLDMVVDKQAVPYVRSDLDLTDRVIQAYNQGGGAGDAKSEKSEKPAKAPKAPGPTLAPPTVTPPAAPKQ
jgi:outer membrane protein